MIAQRIRAIAVANDDQSWDAAKFLELVPDENKSTIYKQSDVRLCRKEAKTNLELSSSGKGSENAKGGSYQWVPSGQQPYQKSKGKGEKAHGNLKTEQEELWSKKTSDKQYGRGQGKGAWTKGTW